MNEEHKVSNLSDLIPLNLVSSSDVPQMCSTFAYTVVPLFGSGLYRSIFVVAAICFELI